jgi:DNA-binding MarR family transcriptional regulator
MLQIYFWQMEVLRLFSVPLSRLNSLLFEELRIKGYSDLKPGHAQVFQHLDAAGSRITELALKAEITKQSMSILVYEMEQAGYLKRQKDKADKRAVIFKLTVKGEKLYALADRILHSIIESWKIPKSEQSLNDLKALLK